MKKVLFLCTANYYRSRFAEQYFNWLAAQTALDWQAHSRALDLSRWDGRRPISHYTVQRLAAGIPASGQQRNPKRLKLVNLVRADLIIAVKRAEHRQMVAQQFPHWTDLVEYWDVGDVDLRRRKRRCPAGTLRPPAGDPIGEPTDARQRETCSRYPNAVRIFSQ